MSDVIGQLSVPLTGVKFEHRTKMADNVYWLAGETVDKVSQILGLIRKQDCWREGSETTYIALQKHHSLQIQGAKVEVLKDAKLQNSTEFLIDLYRRSCSKKLLYDSVFDLKDQLVALQLVMAQLNKERTGVYGVQTGDVLETHRKIMNFKLYMDIEDEDITKLCALYNKFLSYCNAVDFVDILQRVKTTFITNKSVNEIYPTGQQVVVIGQITTDVEKETMNFIVGQGTVKYLSIGEGNQQLQLSEKTIESLLHKGPVAEAPLSIISPTRTHPKQTLPSPEKVAKDQVMKIFLCYLRLLVNSRDELALSQVVNIPNRDLGHKQFTELRKVARQSGMPMFQVAVSFVLRIRLGGKSYAPADDDPLLPLTKGLGDLVSFFQKLQNICEEMMDAKAAVFKVITILKASLIRAKERLFSAESITAVAENLQQKVEELSSCQRIGKSSTSQSTMVGLKSYLLIQAVIDHHVKDHKLTENEMCHVSSALVTPETTHGKSKLRSLLTQFRTPDPEKADICENDSQMTKTTANTEPRVNSNKKIYGDMAWAKPVVNINIGPSPTIKKHHMMMATEDIVSVHKNNSQNGLRSTEGTPRSRTIKRNKESYNDKENVPVQRETNAERQADEIKPPVKRILLDRDTTGRKPPKTKARSKQKKNSLLQGQKQLTQFFR